MRRRFFNAADNFMGGCYNKLSNEDYYGCQMSDRKEGK